MADQTDGPTPGPWELMRMLEKIDLRLSGLVSQEVHKAYQEAVDRRLRDQTEDLTEWKAESRGAHTSLGGQIEAVRQDFQNKLDAQKKESERMAQDARKTKNSTWLAVSLSVLAIVGGFVSQLLLNNIGGA